MSSNRKQRYLTYYTVNGVRKRKAVWAESALEAMKKILALPNVVKAAEKRVEAVIGLETFQMEYVDTMNLASIAN
jgi:hypothetical protein